MINWIIKLFTKKEPELYWGDFKEWDSCKECNHLQEFYHFTICPKCGSRDIKKTVARWQSFMKCKGSTSEIIRVKHEIREDKLND